MRNIDDRVEKEKKEKKLELSCAKLRASLFFSGLDMVLVYFD